VIQDEPVVSQSATLSSNCCCKADFLGKRCKNSCETLANCCQMTLRVEVFVAEPTSIIISALILSASAATGSPGWLRSVADYACLYNSVIVCGELKVDLDKQGRKTRGIKANVP